MTSVYNIVVEDIKGENLDLAEYKGKFLLIVNVASECGFTPQYQQLEELFRNFNDKLVIIGCPSNDFGGQEPGTNTGILEFCQLNYGVSFPLTNKMKILGENCHPLYKWLKDKSLNGLVDSEVEWNFHKYLIDDQGKLIGTFSAMTSPLDETILNLLPIHSY